MSEVQEAPAAEPAAEPAPSFDSTLEDVLRSNYEKQEARENLPDRGEGGRFEGKAPPTEKPADKITDQPATPASETATSIAAPDSWSAERKAEFATLPPATQAYIAERESIAHKAHTQLGELKQYEPFREVLQPHLARVQQTGIPTHEYVNRLLAADAALSNPQTHRQAMEWIARTYGGAAPAQGTQPAGQAQSADPVVAALQNGLSGVTQYLQRKEAEEQTRQQQAIAKANRESDERAAAFLNDPKNPYAKDVEQEMIQLIIGARATGKELTLEQAYEQAVMVNPTVRGKLEAERAKKAKDEADAAAAKKAAEARKNASTVVKPRGSAVKAPGSGATLEDRLRANYPET